MHYAQVGVLVNSRGDIQHIIGRTGKFLEPSAGDATMNALAMAREGLRRDLTVALHKAVAQRQPVVCRGLNVKSNGHLTTTDLVVRPALDGGGASDLYLIVLEEMQEHTDETNKSAAAAEHGGSRVAELEQELQAKE